MGLASLGPTWEGDMEPLGLLLGSSAFWVSSFFQHPFYNTTSLRHPGEATSHHAAPGRTGPVTTTSQPLTLPFLPAAAACEFLDIVELLLKSGADPGLRDQEGCLPEEVTGCKAISSALRQHAAGGP